MSGQHNAMRRSLALSIAAVALLVIGLTGGFFVGSSTTDSTAAIPSVSSLAGRASATRHNAADIAFAQMMAPHHQQALAMAKLAEGRAGSASVKQLAATIEAAQQPEIDKMDGWLRAWGADSAASSGHTMAGMGGMRTGAGMMSPADMKSLSKLTGREFDKQFLTMMTSHHDGALTMAQDELKTGQNADALALATSIVLTQQAQIQQMQRMLGS